MRKPSLLSRIKLAGSLLWGSPWDSANRSPNRSPVPGGSPTDHEKELTPSTRNELIKGSRYLAKSSGFTKEQIETMSLYAVPVMPRGQTMSVQWNRDAQALYADRRKVCDITGRHSGNAVQRLICEAVDRDGEIFAIKVSDPATQLPRLQLVETHRVGDFGKGGTRDGFVINSWGQPTAIRVLLDSGVTALVPMNAVIHVFDPTSPSALRHEPKTSAMINHRVDAEEILAIEKKGVKDNLEVTRVTTLAPGEEPTEENIPGMLSSGGGDSERTDVALMNQILGGKNMVMKAGEDVKSWQSNRPNPTFTGFMEHLDRESALGGMPYGFAINPHSLTTPGVRLVVMRAARKAARRSQMIIERYLEADWFFVIGDAIANGELDAIDNWWNIKGGTPKQATVDVGRNDENIRKNIEAGIMSPSEAANETGNDFYDLVDQTAQDIETIEEIANLRKIDADRLYRVLAAASSNPRP